MLRASLAKEPTLLYFVVHTVATRFQFKLVTSYCGVLTFATVA